jgi:hypothetical protein
MVCLFFEIIFFCIKWFLIASVYLIGGGVVAIWWVLQMTVGLLLLPFVDLKKEKEEAPIRRRPVRRRLQEK